MKRLQLLVAVALVATACSDSELTTGPEGPDPSTNITTGGPSGGLGFGHSDICGTVTDPVNGLPGVQAASPCDGDSNLPAPGTGPDPDKLPFTGSTFWLSSLEANPSPIPANFDGLADRLKVRAYPYPNEQACLDAGGNGSDCRLRDDLPAVTEVLDGSGASLRYETSWKTKKSKAGGPGAGDFLPNNTHWQIVAFLDFDGSGTWDPDEDIASRIIKWTDTPSSDNPLSGWSLDINWGSNQPIPFVLEANQSGCFGTAEAPVEVVCLVDFDQGGTLILETGDGAVILQLGAGNDLGLRTVTGTECDDSAIDVDTETVGTCTNWEVFPPLTSSDPDLIDSFLYVCEDLLGTVDLTGFVIHMSDEDGIQALQPVAQATASSACSTNDYVASAGEMGTGFQYVLNSVKRLFTPAPLFAGHGSSGSRLTTIRSDFQLVQTAQMRPVGGTTSYTVAENGSVTLQSILKDHADEDGGIAVSNALVYVYSEAGTGSTVACTYGAPSAPSDPGPWCDDLTTLPAWAGDGVLVKTGANGIVEASATVATSSAEVRMLGCAIAVPGSDTPAGGGVAGDGGPCDRDPADEDDGTAGYANGQGVGITDPFMKDGVFEPTWANDLPLVYSLQVCSAPTVDGVKSATDPWSQGAPSACVPAGFSDSFEVNVGGNLGGGGANPVAQLEWFVGTDANQDRRIYFGLEIPVGSDPTSKKVSVAVTFDQGDGSPASSGVADENDDQIVLELNKFSASTTGDVTDRYLKSSCTTGTSVCNSDDADLGGDNDAQGAMAWDAASGTLFIELSQKLTGGDATVDMSGIDPGDVIGFMLQFGVGNVQQGGTVYPSQSGGRAYTTVLIP